MGTAPTRDRDGSGDARGRSAATRGRPTDAPRRSTGTRGRSAGARSRPADDADRSAGDRGRSADDPDRSARARGQTPVDFVVAMGLFLAVLGIVVWFLPGLLAPTTGTPEPSATADRSAARIAGPLLGAPGTPSALNESCTAAFFGGPGGTNCPFDPTESVRERVGLSPEYELNATVERNVTGGPEPEVLCLDGGTLGACTGSGTRLAAGPTPPTDGGSTAYRVVALDGRNVRLNARVWR